MSHDAFRQLAPLAATQHGVFTHRDAREVGVPSSTLSNAVAQGRFVSPYPRVYVVAGSPETLSQRMTLVALSMPTLAAISHDTAAELWGMTSRGIRKIHVVTARWDRAVRLHAIVHESLDLMADDVVVRRGIPVTSAERTIVDLGATNKWAVEQALEQGIRQSLFRVEDVERVVDRVGRKGRRGVGVIRSLLEERRQWDQATESALEDLFRVTLDEMGLPVPEPQYVVRNDKGEYICRADFAFPQSRVLIELDSEAYHMDRVSFRRDRNKQNQAVALGWTVLRFTWWDLREKPYEVAAYVGSVLGASESSRRSIPAWLRPRFGTQ